MRHLPLRTLSHIAQRVREVSGLKAEVFLSAAARNQQKKGNCMARYVSLIRFTDQGARALKKAPPAQ
jgi:hypothetical protein